MHILENMQDQHRKTTFVMNRGRLESLLLLQTTFVTWAMWTQGTEWLMAVQLIGQHGSGQKIIFPPLGHDCTEYLYNFVVLQ